MISALSDKGRYTTWKVPAKWNGLIEAYREKHKEAFGVRGVNSNSAAVLYILTRVMESEGLLNELEIEV